MGSASLYYATLPNKAILSDINSELVSTYISVRDHPKAVHNRLMALPKGRESYYELRGKDPKNLSPLNRAARFIFLNRFCFNGIYRTNEKGYFNVPFASSGTGDLPTWEHFSAVAKVLRKAKIFMGDFSKVLNEIVREGDFVYLDPPYAVENRRVFRQYGPQTFGLEDLGRRRDALKLIDRRGGKFVLSYASSPEAREFFFDWNCKKVYTQRNVSGFAKHRRMAAELIFSNI